MAKGPTLDDVGNILNGASTINNNNDKIETAFDNTLSRDGSTPNQMEADLDMNSNDILNVKNIFVNGTVLPTNGFIFNERNKTNAAYIKANLSDGEVAIMAGLAYEVDSSATGANSATRDLGEDGLKPYGPVAYGAHFGFVQSPDDCSNQRIAAQTWLNATDGMLIIEKGTYIDSATTYVLDHSAQIKQGDFDGGLSLFNSARGTPFLSVVETDDNPVLDSSLTRAAVSATATARGAQHVDAGTFNLNNYSTDGQGNTAIYTRAHTTPNAFWSAALHGEVRFDGGTGVGASIEIDPFSDQGSLYGITVNNVASGGFATHPLTGAPKTEHPTVTGLYFQGGYDVLEAGGWKYGIRFAENSMHGDDGISIRYDSPAQYHHYINTTAVTTVADVIHNADSPYGTIWNGTYTNGAWRVSDDSYMALRENGAIKWRYDTTSGYVDFYNSGVLRHSFDLTGNAPVYVRHHGAVGDGVTNDTAAFQAAIDDLPSWGGVIHLEPNKDYNVTVGTSRS